MHETIVKTVIKSGDRSQKKGRKASPYCFRKIILKFLLLFPQQTWWNWAKFQGAFTNFV
jgi:hypothetical protein